MTGVVYTSIVILKVKIPPKRGSGFRNVTVCGLVDLTNQYVVRIVLVRTVFVCVLVYTRIVFLVSVCECRCFFGAFEIDSVVH